MVRFIKSLTFNLGEGKDVKRHREHRSKKGRNLWNKANSPEYLKYKMKKFEKKYEDDEESLLF